MRLTVTALCALPALVLLALILKRKSPGQLLYGLVREAEKGLRRAGLCVPSLRLWVMERNPQQICRSPFARLNGAVPDHSPILLNLPTSDGSGEATHPDVLHVPQGWGAGGWTWLMAMTPYPLGTDYHENPEFCVSYDGIQWTVPEGLHPPLARVPLRPRNGARAEFHSDPSLLLAKDGELLYYYRWTAVFSSETENRILLMTSRDGVHWTPPEAVLEERRPTGLDRKFLSPSALFLNGEYALWTVDCEGGERFIVRRSGPDGRHWGDPVRTAVSAPFPLSAPWHLDVADDKGVLRILLTTAAERGYEAELFLGSGDGLSWKVEGKPFTPAYHFEGKRVYRSSLVPLGNGRRRIYYSALSLSGTWNVAMLDAATEKDNS